MHVIHRYARSPRSRPTNAFAAARVKVTPATRGPLAAVLRGIVSGEAGRCSWRGGLLLVLAVSTLCAACGAANRPRYRYTPSWKGGAMRGLAIPDRADERAEGKRDVDPRPVEDH